MRSQSPWAPAERGQSGMVLCGDTPWLEGDALGLEIGRQLPGFLYWVIPPYYRGHLSQPSRWGWWWRKQLPPLFEKLWPYPVESMLCCVYSLRQFKNENNNQPADRGESLEAFCLHIWVNILVLSEGTTTSRGSQKLWIADSFKRYSGPVMNSVWHYPAPDTGSCSRST